jgi:RHS repeat-associated protein
MAQSSGAITYAKAYDPYGVVTSTAGSAQSAYGYTGEYTSNNLVYLRARIYAPGMGRFLTRDTWEGSYSNPLTLNRWNYTASNPINYTDPSGNFSVACEPLSQNGWCSEPITIFGIPIPIFTIPVPCNSQTPLQPWIYSTPTGTPQAPTSTPGPGGITQTPNQTQAQGTATQTQTPTPQATAARVQLYRAIDSIELAVVISTGTYGYSPSGGGKYFAFTYSGAVNFANSPLNAEKEMTITNIDIPMDFQENGYTFNDVGGAGLSIHFSDAVLPELYVVMSAIRILGSP